MPDQHHYIYQIPERSEPDIHRIVGDRFHGFCPPPEGDHCKYCGHQQDDLLIPCDNPKCNPAPYRERICAIKRKMRNWLPQDVDRQEVHRIFPIMAFNCNGNLNMVEALLRIPFDYHVLHRYEMEGGEV